MLILKLILYDMYFEVIVTWCHPYTHLCTVHYPYRSTEYDSVIKNTVQEENLLIYFVKKTYFLRLFDKYNYTLLGK